MMEGENDLQPYIELLCGISHSGKTTFVEDRYTEGFDGVVLSRDKLVMKYGKGSTYNECWDSLTKALQRMIDSELEEQYDRAVELRLNVVIDLMNLTKRQRSRWLLDLPECYVKRARVFKVPVNIIKKRNSLLFDEKFIPEDKLRDMLNRFEVPRIGEFDEVL